MAVFRQLYDTAFVDVKFHLPFSHQPRQKAFVDTLGSSI